MRNFLNKYSIIIKLFILYIIFHISTTAWNTYILENIDSFHTAFANQKRLIYYPETPELSLKSHWINKHKDSPGYKIIVVGDSKVQDIYVGYEYSITGQLNRLLFGDFRLPNVFNFGTSGLRMVYAYERVKKAISYKPDLIVLALGAGNFMDVDWVMPPPEDYYDISLGKDFAGAYRNLLKINSENAPFISENLRGNIIPTYSMRTFYDEYFKGMQAKKENRKIRDPGELLINVQIGDVKPNIFGRNMKFSEEGKYFEIVRKIASLALYEDVKLMIYIPPVHQEINDILYEPGYYDKLVEAIKKQLKGYDVPVLDLTKVVPDELFLDGGHLKEYGDLITAEHLADFIKKNYDIEK